jgi:hypothetical protein
MYPALRVFTRYLSHPGFSPGPPPGCSSSPSSPARRLPPPARRLSSPASVPLRSSYHPLSLAGSLGDPQCSLVTNVGLQEPTTTLFGLISVGGNSCGLEFTEAHINSIVLALSHIFIQICEQKFKLILSYWTLQWATLNHNKKN